VKRICHSIVEDAVAVARSVASEIRDELNYVRYPYGVMEDIHTE
jgi:hypothetical protein